MSIPSRIPDDVAALITAYALGVLDYAEASAAEAHIAASDDCRRAYEDALETAAALALAVGDSEPPAGLRERIVAAAAAEPGAAPLVHGSARPAASGRSWMQRFAGLLTPSGGFALAGVAAAIVLALVAVAQHGSADRARDRQAALVSILARSGCAGGLARAARRRRCGRARGRLAESRRADQLARPAGLGPHLPGLGHPGRRRCAGAPADLLADGRTC